MNKFVLFASQHKETLQQVTALLTEKEELLQRIHDLDDQVSLSSLAFTLSCHLSNYA